MRKEGITESEPKSGHNIIRKLKALEKAVKLKKAGIGNLSLSFDAAVLKIGKIVFVFLPGEEFAEIGLQIKDLAPENMVIPVTFYNAICSYIPTAQACIEGGFEPNAFPWCGVKQPFPFAGVCEEIIVKNMSSLLEKIQG